MSDPQRDSPSGFFDVLNKSTLAVSKKAAGAGVVGLVGFFGILVVAGIFFVTENFFIAMLGASLALLVYATGADVGKLLMSSFTIFFSSKHLTPKAAQLQATQKEQQKLIAENQQLRARLQEFQQVKTENSTLQNQNQQLQGALAGQAAVRACLNNLKQIELAKAAWALEMRKTPADVPLDTDLFGPNKYIAQQPVCPAGGIYTLGAVGAKPTCSAPGHAR